MNAPLTANKNAFEIPQKKDPKTEKTTNKFITLTNQIDGNLKPLSSNFYAEATVGSEASRCMRMPRIRQTANNMPTICKKAKTMATTPTEV